MELKGHLLYYPEGKHDINLDNYIQKSQLNDALKSKVDSITKTTYTDLKNLRDNSQLVPGALYRITDYQCTTTQENTQSAGHQFDIVLLALSENKLAEEGWAMEHPTDVYDVTFSDGVTLKCYIYTFGEDDEEYNKMVNIVNIDNGNGFSTSFSDLTVDDKAKTASTDVVASDELELEGLPYNYFQNSNLSAWKVWYCLDNDKDRFAWADDTYKLNPASIICDCYRAGTKVDGPIDYPGKQFVNGTIYYRDEENDTTVPHMGNMPMYAWTSENNITIFTQSVSPNSFSDTYTYSKGNISSISGGMGITYKTTSYVEGLPNYDFPNGRGVIYRLIDEFNNDIKYDFKNIQFKRKITDGQYDADNGTDTWCYTFNIWYDDICQDASIVGNTLPNDEGFVTGVYDNIFGYATAYDFYIEGVDTFAFALGDNVVLSFDDDAYYGIYSNKIGDFFYSNTIGSDFHSNTIGNHFNFNNIGNNFNCNIIGNSFSGNTVGYAFCCNIIGNNVSDNTFGNDVSSNTIGNDFLGKNISNSTGYKNYGNNGVELATKDDLN